MIVLLLILFSVSVVSMIIAYKAISRKGDKLFNTTTIIMLISSISMLLISFIEYFLKSGG